MSKAYQTREWKLLSEKEREEILDWSHLQELQFVKSNFYCRYCNESFYITPQTTKAFQLILTVEEQEHMDSEVHRQNALLAKLAHEAK